MWARVALDRRQRDQKTEAGCNLEVSLWTIVNVISST